MIHSVPHSDTETGEPSLLIGAPITDPDLVARSRLQMERFERNSAWFEAHSRELGEKYAGKFVSIVGGNLFVGDDVEKLYEQVRASRPDDWNAAFTKYIRPRSVG